MESSKICSCGRCGIFCKRSSDVKTNATKCSWQTSIAAWTFKLWRFLNNYGAKIGGPKGTQNLVRLAILVHPNLSTKMRLNLLNQNHPANGIHVYSQHIHHSGWEDIFVQWHPKVTLWQFNILLGKTISLNHFDRQYCDSSQNDSKWANFHSYAEFPNVKDSIIDDIPMYRCTWLV